MFSVDNFYSTILHRYGHSDNFILKFPDGEKKWDKLIFFSEGCNHPSEYHYGKIVLHDQEPLFFSMIEQYRKKWITDKISVGDDPDLINQIGNSISDADLLHVRLRSGIVPIIGHSEKNSEVINYLDSSNFIDCYYWWHGMIAQDWYRHWKWHLDLTTKNKSLSTYRFLLYARGKTGTRNYRNKLINDLEPYRSKVLYNWSEKELSPLLSASISVADATSAHLHIVAETLFETEKIHLTEKIFKPMVMSQAFILFGPPCSLQYLRDHGFMTFDTVWDESYDDEKNHDKRMCMLVALIKKLAEMDQDEFYSLCEKTLPIIQHNRRLFFSDSFQEYLVKEMFDNFNAALEIQKEKSHEFPAGTWFDSMAKMGVKIETTPLSWQNHMKDILINLKANAPDRLQDTRKKYPTIVDNL